MFTVFQLLQNIGSSISFYYALWVPFHGDHGTNAQLWIQGSIILMSVLGVWRAEYLLNQEEEEEEEEEEETKEELESESGNC